MISCSVLRSLAEDEVKTEADVVEGMDASVRSKGKSLRPSSFHQQVTISVFTECRLLRIDVNRKKKKVEKTPNRFSCSFRTGISVSVK